MSEIVNFKWDVPEQGYRWEVVSPEQSKEGGPDGRPRRLLTDGTPIGGEHKVRVTTPLKDYPGMLYRNFSKVPPTTEGILNFANGNGSLGSAAVSEHFALPPDRDGERFAAWGEDEMGWCKQIADIRHAINLWDLAEAGDEAGLSELILWHKNAVKAVYPNGGGFQIAADHINTDLWKILRKGELVRPAKMAVQVIINRHLNEPNHVTAKLFWDIKEDRLEQLWTPSNLLAAIWYDFAVSVSGNRKYNKCPVCGDAFLMPVKGPAKLYCSSRCRTAAHRKKRG